MNSYNENLHSSVLSSLESQEMTKKQLSTQLNASMFTLYYAEGAEIVAEEKLEATTSMYKEKQLINTVVVKNKNMADNLLLSANQQKTYTTQSVTNMAVCASNIQIASNSIVRLASDIGSIYSIINAADYGTQIYQQAFEAYNLINKTAYNAEETSQHAMEASASIAEVATSTVADEAKLTNTSVNNLLQVTTTDLTAITAVLTTDNDTKSKASIATRAAEGVIKCSMVEYEASKKAYEFNNEKFNQNLNVHVPAPFDEAKSHFTVSFNYYKSPFSPKDKDTETQNLGLDKPVQNYNIILVKDSKKSFFNVSTAEDLLTNPSQFKRIAVPSDSSKIGTSVNIRFNELLDSDNQALVLGQNYVAFLLIIFTENYKKEINTFDEYLSAPSETFALTHTLNNADAINISRESGSKDLSKINFTVEREADLKASELEYRCFLLPYPEDLLTTNEDLTTLEFKIETLELEEEIKTVEEEIKALNEEIENINSGASEVTPDATKSAKDQDLAKQKNSNFKNALNEAKAKLNIANDQLKKLKAELAETEKSAPKPVKNKNAFFFNLNLAENIPAGNYTNAKHHRGTSHVAEIDSTSTDNFGNPLIEDKKYIPVVLSFYNGPEVSKSKYTNSLSDWQNTTPVAYSTKETLTTTN
ncbi:hypothetical protein C8C83_4199 [Flavobacterium sp. 90]|uniref:hypothetical protein n=1 Tax=unclassified Flavobacterium TaxID=196869 RepID=UPI000EB02960|nr:MULTISPECIES: hypothetical protein [unclassified Flavobacterium]RKR04866.1 hypothetical protein C8C82_4532 [Flavobacterium sp. 81]TCK56187.1 hypothetical protein C8C83_4199 [Flavobacterium sp. 90]